MADFTVIVTAAAPGRPIPVAADPGARAEAPGLPGATAVIFTVRSASPFRPQPSPTRPAEIPLRAGDLRQERPSRGWVGGRDCPPQLSDRPPTAACWSARYMDAALISVPKVHTSTHTHDTLAVSFHADASASAPPTCRFPRRRVRTHEWESRRDAPRQAGGTSASRPCCPASASSTPARARPTVSTLR